VDVARRYIVKMPKGFEITDPLQMLKPGHIVLQKKKPGASVPPGVYHTADGRKCWRTLLLISADAQGAGLLLLLQSQLLKV